MLGLAQSRSIQVSSPPYQFSCSIKNFEKNEKKSIQLTFIFLTADICNGILPPGLHEEKKRKNPSPLPFSSRVLKKRKEETRIVSNH